MINVQLEEYEALEMLMERLKVWTHDRDVQALYEKMYESYIDNGVFDGGEFNVNQIVDNDWVNWCDTVCEGEDEFENVKKVYEKNGLGDCSCEDETYFDYIEAVDDENKPTMFLCRQ